MGIAQVSLVLPPGGADSTSSVGSANDFKVGYTTLSVNSGSAPCGTAVFSYKENGVVTSEAGVPASPPTVAARFFVDSRLRLSTPGSTGLIDISTGFALVNQGGAAANLSLRLRDSNGITLSQGILQLQRGEHIAKYLDQLQPGFVLPPDFASNGLGSLEITSDQPISVLAMRLTYNQRHEFLMTTTPTADLTNSLSNGPLSFPQIADGGGYQTAIVLMNTSNAVETGVVRFSTSTGAALGVRPEGSGAIGYQFPYYILPGGLFRLVTDGSPPDVNTGWALVIPDFGSYAPVGAAVFGLTQNGVLITETGVPAATPTTHARIYVDRSGHHDTGLAIANPGWNSLRVTATAYQLDGVTPAGFAPGVINLPALGHDAEYIWQIIGELPDDFVGVLDLSSSSPFSALTMRFLTNERGDFLLTTFPIADLNQPPPMPLVFPQVADGQGSQTQFILLNPGLSTSIVTLQHLGSDGSPIAIGLEGRTTALNSLYVGAWEEQPGRQFTWVFHTVNGRLQISRNDGFVTGDFAKTDAGWLETLFWGDGNHLNQIILYDANAQCSEVRMNHTWWYKRPPSWQPAAYLGKGGRRFSNVSRKRDAHQIAIPGGYPLGMAIERIAPRQRRMLAVPRLQIVEEFRRGGLTRAAFARQSGIPLATLDWRLAKAKRSLAVRQIT